MKTTEHVEYLLRQGKKRKELLALGFPKQVITKVRRRLREEKTTSPPRTEKGKGSGESRPRSAVTPLVETTPVQPGSGSLEEKVRQLESRVEVLEAISAEIEDIENRLQGTPALGLKQRFKCDCGASGLVALHVQCTKCGRESWWGWFPKE